MGRMTASICGGIYARVYCILYCVYDVVVGKTTESDRQIWWSCLVVKKVHVRYLILWWVSCYVILTNCICICVSH